MIPNGLFQTLINELVQSSSKKVKYSNIVFFLNFVTTDFKQWIWVKMEDIIYDLLICFQENMVKTLKRLTVCLKLIKINYA